MKAIVKNSIYLLLGLSVNAVAGDFIGVHGGYAYRLVPRVDLRTRDTVRQQLDWSCASASIATLVAEKFEIKVPEQPLFDLVVAPLAGNVDALRQLEQKGLTFAHLAQMAEALGLHGRGIARSLAGLLESQDLPVIARIVEPHPDEPDREFQHWVVIRGIAGNRVLIRDPVRGNRRMPVYAFAAAWLETDGKHKGKGFLFEVERDPNQFGRVHFDSESQGSRSTIGANGAAANNSISR